MQLSALPYHAKVKDHFYIQTKTWQFFASAKTKESQLLEFKAELLKNSYKFDSAIDKTIYEKVNLVKEKLRLENLPVTVYQAQYTEELNAIRPQEEVLPVAKINVDATPNYTQPIITSVNSATTILITPYDSLSFKKLTCTENGSQKFWEGAIDVNKLVVRFGKIGTKGQTQVKTFSDYEMANKELEKLVREKLGKGYVGG